MISELCLTDGEFSVKHYPIERDGNGVRLSHNREILEGFERRSREILEEGFVERKYRELIEEIKPTVETHLSRFAAAITEEKSPAGATARNVINCDPHREAIIAYLTERHGLK